MDAFVRDGAPHIICTPNFDHVVQCQADLVFRNIIENCALSVADGMGVIYASWLLGEPLPENVSGRVLCVEFCRLASQRGYRVCLLGGGPGIAEKAADTLQKQFPGLKVVDAFGPEIGSGPDNSDGEASVQRVRRCSPDVLFVALGAPKQEMWLSRNQHSLGVPVCMGVGYTFDLLAGKYPLPPEWATRVGLEWLYRLLHDPVRLGKRYVVQDLAFVPKLLAEIAHKRIKRPVTSSVSGKTTTWKA
jgi:N-acetylglucosaminyldiphosphoundecaprenol N-acetyl-beta-D-mannosaminyltransferase